jgi:hypothetical protein
MAEGFATPSLCERCRARGGGGATEAGCVRRPGTDRAPTERPPEPFVRRGAPDSSRNRRGTDSGPGRGHRGTGAKKQVQLASERRAPVGSRSFPAFLARRRAARADADAKPEEHRLHLRNCPLFLNSYAPNLRYRPPPKSYSYRSIFAPKLRDCQKLPHGTGSGTAVPSTSCGRPFTTIAHVERRIAGGSRAHARRIRVIIRVIRAPGA